jgi:hypothetical protein
MQMQNARVVGGRSLNQSHRVRQYAKSLPRREKRNLLSQIAVRIHLRVLDPFEILALDKRFDALLDHGDLGLELRSELIQRLENQLLMRQFFALPDIYVSPRPRIW